MQKSQLNKKERILIFAELDFGFSRLASQLIGPALDIARSP